MKGTWEQFTRGGEFLDSAGEQRYRRSQIGMERRQLQRLWLLALVFFLLYGLAEFLMAQWPDADPDTHSQVGLWTLAPRLVILLTGILVLALEGGILNPSRRDALACAALVIVGACYALLLLLRDNPGNPTGAVILLVCGMYLFSPGRFILVCASGVICSLCTGWVFLQRSGGDAPPWLAFSYLLPTNVLAAFALAQFNRMRRLGYLQRERLQLEVRAREKMARALRRSHRRNRELLYNALPLNIARQLAARPGEPIANYHPWATVLFVDLVGFSSLSRRCRPQELVQFLDHLFSRFDTLAAQHGVEKIKTLGDAWMGVAGLDSPAAVSGGCRGPGSALGLALDLLLAAGRCEMSQLDEQQLRIGIHSGPLVAGVIGQQRYAFDVWGETVNIASRLQAAAQPGRILVSARCREGCEPGCLFGPPRNYRLKGCGEIEASNFYGVFSGPQLPGDSSRANLCSQPGGL